MVPSLPVTPGPAVTGPVTGGQKVAHDPLQFDSVEVSGTNQYSVKPLELVSTCVPLMVALSTVFALALEAGAEAAGLPAPAAGVLAADEEPLRAPARRYG